MVGGTIPFDDKLESAAALFPCTSTFSDAVNPTKISHNPSDNSVRFNSSLIPNTAKNAVVSLWTEYTDFFRSRTLMHFCTAPAATNARLFRSDDAANYPQMSVTTQKTAKELVGKKTFRMVMTV